jgi:hypothetical protein
MKRLCLFGGLFAASLIIGAARADEGAACFDAAEKGQTLRAAHKLVDARDQFRLCAAPTCPASVQTDCVTWVAEVEKGVPTVVLSAKDATGNDVIDLDVTMDGAPLATKLDGTSLPVNPGPHTFRFQWSDGTSRDLQKVIAEGQKDVVVAVSLAPIGGVAGPPALVGPAAVLTQRPTAAAGGPPWHTIGWITGGVGVAGLILGGVFSAITISDKNAADCNSTTHTCTNYGSMNSAMSAASVSGVGYIGGGVLVATGAAFLLFTRGTRETPTRATSTTVRVGPMAGARVGGAIFEGAW